MSTIRLHTTTTATPEQFLAGLTDFGPGRSKLFGNSAEQQGSLHPDRVAREGTIENGDRRGRLMDYRPGECRTYEIC